MATKQRSDETWFGYVMGDAASYETWLGAFGVIPL